jgi:hypothetical protein
MRLLLAHAPNGFAAALDPLPDDVTVETAPQEPAYDAVIVCVTSIAEAETRPAAAGQKVKPGGLFWTCYPKKTGAIRTDITRDKGWDTLMAAGWGPVSQVSVNETWSALRWRPETDIMRKENSQFSGTKREQNAGQARD